jgi:6-pyruvoyltetrahydropterin/6-carboxytetrahydropterin synthase
MSEPTEGPRDPLPGQPPAGQPVVEIWKELGFEAAHLLPHAPPGHKCARLHGHSFRFTVHVAGPVDPVAGWVVDFADVATACGPLVDELDHRFLNDVPGLGNPTSEVLTTWIWARLAPRLPGLRRVTVQETCTSGATYEGPPPAP